MGWSSEKESQLIKACVELENLRVALAGAELARDAEYKRACKIHDEMMAERSLADYLAEGVKDLYEHSHYLETYYKARRMQNE